MPKVTPGPGQAVEETTVTRILPDTKSEQEKNGWDALEYMDSTPAQKWNEGDHIIYVYRVEPILYRGASGPAYVTKYAAPVTLEQIQKEYGGGLFRIVIKRGSERMADSRYQLSGTPRDLTRGVQEFNPALPGGVPQPTETGGVVSQAMSIVADPTSRTAQVQMLTSAATAAVDLVKANATQQLTVKDILELAEKMNTRGQDKPFLDTEVGKILIAAASALVTALVQRVVTPTDPLDQLTKLAEAAKIFGGGSSTNDWKAALVQAAPQIAEAGRGMLQELRMGAEAQMRINAGRTLPAGPPPMAPPVQQNPAAQNVVQMPAAPAQTGSDPMEAFEIKLVELLNDPNMTGDKAGEILDATWPRIVDEVCTYSVDQIIGAFPRRPLLRPHATNPRLRQFLTEFLQWANETDTPPLTPPGPAA